MNLEEWLIYRDALILVLNKPTGVPVHAGSGKLRPLTDYFDSLQFGLPNIPQLAHRLDKDTSGCLILGRNNHALKTLANLFKDKKICKYYHAIVEGEIEQESGIIDLPLAKQNDKKYLWWMKVDEKGQASQTEYKVIAVRNNKSLVELKPITGRTHQLRVHMQAINCPIIGDKIYGSNNNLEQPLLLHASKVMIPLYKNKPPLVINAPFPDYFPKELVKELG